MNYHALYVVLFGIAVILEAYRRKAAEKKKQAEIAAGTYKAPRRWFFTSFLIAIILLLVFGMIYAFTR